MYSQRKACKACESPRDAAEREKDFYENIGDYKRMTCTALMEPTIKSQGEQGPFVEVDLDWIQEVMDRLIQGRASVERPVVVPTFPAPVPLSLLRLPSSKREEGRPIKLKW